MNKYKILLLLVLINYSQVEASEKNNETFSSLSGSISGFVVNSLESTGCSDGSISLDISNPDAPFYIQWSNGETTETIDNLSPGEYCVTVTDNLCGEARGCWEIKCCPFLLEDEQIQYNISHPACEGHGGELELVISDVANDEFPLSLYLENLNDQKNYDLSISSSSSSFDDLPEGDYYAQINYGEGCTYNFDFLIEFKPIEIQFDKTASCDNDGTIKVYPSEGALPYTYAWEDDPNATSSYRDGLNSNIYMVTVTDANLCTAAASVFVKDSDPIITDNMSVYITNSECNSNTGEIDIYNDPEGGSAPFTFEWSNGESGKLIENLAGDTYQLTITDEEGCTKTTSYTVPIDGQPTILSVVIDNTCNQQNTGAIGVLATSTNGGTLTYIWSNSVTEFVNENLGAGMYTVTITDQSNGCTLVEDYEVEDLSLEPISISEAVKNNCESEGTDNGEISLSILGGKAPYDILWNTSATTSTIQNLSTGEYTATITDDCGNVELFNQVITSVQLSMDIDVSYPNFEDIIIEVNMSGGSSPYEYVWNTGSTASFLVVQDEGTYSVTITDQNGCSKSETVDVLCDQVDFQFVTNFFTENCTSPFTLILDPSQNYGPGPFTIKIEKKINQEFEVVDYRLFQTHEELLAYTYQDGDTGNFKVTATNYCGYTETESFSGCVDCDYYFYNVGDNYFASVMGDLIIFELECPCNDDCGIFGLTTDKVKLTLNQQALAQFSNGIAGSPSFEVVWPTGPSSYIFFSVNQGKFIISGPTQYVLSHDEFDAGGITASVSMTLPYGVGEVCNLDIPFEFGQKGYNGYFHKWDNEGLDPFINHDPPYNWATIACLYKCVIPVVSGVLYENEPIDSYDERDNYASKCDSEEGESVTVEYFLYLPNYENNPCNGGGHLLTHYESVVGVVSGEVIIPQNVAIEAPGYWASNMLEENDPLYPYTCPANEHIKGYCLFDSKDVYGEDVQLRDPIMASYCKTRFYDPPIDTDGDGIPDTVDPCPLNPDVFCDGTDDDGDIDPGGIDPNGCQTTFLPDQCQLAIVCPDEEVTYVDGTIEAEYFFGEIPCVHCFSVDVCRVAHPETGEEFSEIVGPISGSVEVSIGNLPECGNVCTIIFDCAFTEESYYLCAADCQTSTNPLCGYSQLNDIVSILQEEGGPQSIELEMTKELALEIIDFNREGQRLGENKNELKTMPNPSQNGFVVVYNSEKDFSTTLEIKNMLKESVFQKEVYIQKGVNQIDIEDQLPSGIYIISIFDQQNLISTKHVVQN